jgi:hypothetical protein
MPLPTDQTRQFDYPPGRGKTVMDSLAAPSATAVSAATRSDALVKNGNATGTGPGTNTPRPASGSNWIAGGAVSGYGTVTAGSNPAPLAYAQRDAIRNVSDSAAIPGPQPPSGLSAAAPTGTSPTASVALTWAAPAGYPPAASYKIYKQVGTGAWGPGTPATSATLTATETGLSTGTVKFRVTAVAGLEESPVSNAVTVTIP